MKRQVIRVKDGKVTCLYSDALDLHRMIGPSMRVERASNVEYDLFREGWTVQFANGSFLEIEGKTAVFPKRADALAAEVAVLQAQLRG